MNNLMRTLYFNSEIPCVIEHPDKAKILVFMRHGEMMAASPSAPKDRITGESIPVDEVIYASEGYTWTSVDTWYFDTYNFQLPDDFIQIALEHYLDHLRRNPVMK